MLRKPSLLKRDIRGVPRLDIVVYGEVDFGKWTVPNLMVAASLTDGRRAPENEMGHRSEYDGPANQTVALSFSTGIRKQRS
jgi:hypothetical protein